MARGDDSPSTLRGTLEEHALPALLVVTALSLLLRLDRLGERVAHWDEGRVGYDVLRYGETGLWEYRPIVHGPFLPHVNDAVFAALGPTDFAMRLVVAVVGGLLPLAPWLFRRHLRDLEVVGAGVFLAFDPILLYYSRFMRNDVLLATFMLFALGAFVRFADTRRLRYLYGVVVLVALGFTTKENAVVYLACWLGAGALVVDAALFRPYAERPTREYVRGRAAALRARARDADLAFRGGYYGGHLVLALSLGFAIIVYFFAPRTGGTGVGLERLGTRPDLLPAVAEAAVTDLWEGIADWGGKSGDARDYDSVAARFGDYLARFVAASVSYSGALVLFALAGVVGERYLADRPRPLVLFFGYWGLVSVPGYALGTDIWSTWVLVHALVPLAIPAGVALGWVARRGLDALDSMRTSRPTTVDVAPRPLSRRTFRDTPAPDAVLSVTVAALFVLSMLTVGGSTAFDPTNTRTHGEDHIVQYAQPNQDVRETLADLESAVSESDDPVLYYAEEYAIDDESAAYRPPVEGEWVEEEDGNYRQVADNGNWYRRLPLPWYLERAGADRLSAHDETELAERIRQDDPVAIVTMRERDGEDNEEVVDRHADGYVKVVHEMRSPGLETVFYVRADALEPNVRDRYRRPDGTVRLDPGPTTPSFGP